MHASTSKNSFQSVLALVLLLSASFWLYLHGSLASLASNIINYSEAPQSSWQTIVSFDSYSYIKWRPNFFTGVFSNDLTISAIFSSAILACTLLLALIQQVNFFSAFCISFFISVCIIALYGTDPVILQTAALLPILIFAGELLHQRNFHLLTFIIAIILGLVVTVFANQLSFLPILLTTYYLAYLSQRYDSMQNAIYAFGLFMPATFLLLIAPTPEWANYPAVARSIPLLTEVGPINPVDREFIRHAFGWLSFATLVIAGMSLLVNHKTIKHNHIFCLLIIIFIVCLDAKAPEEISQQSPLAVLSRLLPGLYYLPLTPAYFACCLVLVSIFIYRHAKSSGLILWSLFLLTIIFYGPRFKHDISNIPPYLVKNNAFVDNYQEFQERCPDFKKVISGSARVWSENYPLLPCPGSNLSLESLKNTPNKLSSSLKDQPKRIEKIADGTTRTSWVTKEKMSTSDWIQIEFAETQILSGVIMQSGKQANWSAKSFLLEIATSCESGTIEWLKTDYLQKQPAIMLTNDGYYYQANKGVSFYWKNPIHVKCLKISPAEVVDKRWAVGELVVIKN